MKKQSHWSMWVSTGVAVTIAIYITKSAIPLWAFMIPALVIDGAR